jgi:hypothetical protein
MLPNFTQQPEAEASQAFQKIVNIILEMSGS